jgi:transposase InsO family protein
VAFGFAGAVDRPPHHCQVSVCRHGVPQYLLTDRGSNFTSGYVKDFLATIQCKHITTTAYRPQVNELCERMNQTLVQALAKTYLQAEDTKNWDDHLNQALLAIRTMPNDVTGITPARLLYGYEVRTPATWPPPRQDYVEGSIEEELTSRIKVVDYTMRELWHDVQEREEERKRAYKKRYDRLVYRRTLEVGDLVLMRDQVPAGKLDARW